MSAPRHPPRIFHAALLSLLLFALSCVDAPSAPDDGFVAGPLVFAPNLTLVGPGGAPAASEAQEGALAEAFDLVDRFHMVVRRATNNVVVVDTTIVVTPGQESYDLSASVTVNDPDEQFLVSFTALQGEIELFSSPPLRVTATPESSTSSSPPTPVNVTLTYSGPGATATSVEVEPAVVVVGPGGTATLTATVLDDAGNAMGGVPMSWTTGSAAVATVADGDVTGHGDGITSVTVTTPTGLQATASAYVVSGSLAYVEGGSVFVRAAAGGAPEQRSSATGASAPAWTADGSRLYYAAQGSARLAGVDAPIVEGGWPAASPNGAYLAVDQGGQVVFANADGSLEAEGPSGTTPVWADDGTLIVGGGSIHQVDVSGSGRSTLVPGDAQLPALGPGGAVAYVSGGELRVTGRAGSLASGVVGRPSWSAGGTWLAFPGAEGIMVVPANGSAPAAALPGLAAGADPAWQPSGSLAGPSAPSLTGLDPDPPTPGQPVDILGSGFDRIIPGNNHVFWPTPDGSEETEVSSVQAGSISTVMPRRVEAGQIRVENRAGTAVLAFVPSLGALEVSASTPWNAAVAGVGIVLMDAGGTEVAGGETDADGTMLLAGLQPGGYTVHITPPSGYELAQARAQSVEIGTETVLLELVLTPLVARVESDPAVPVVEVGGSLRVGLVAYDAAGDVIPEVQSGRWAGVTSHLSVGGSGLSGVIAGVVPTDGPGDAEYSVRIDGQLFVLTATVTSRIRGTVTKSTGEVTEPVRGHGVTLTRDGVTVGATSSDGSGHYLFDGLLGGEYSVRPAESAGMTVDPSHRIVTLNAATPIGRADFLIYPAVVSGGGRLAGRVIHAVTGAGLANANVEFVTGTGSIVDAVQTASDGNFTSGDLVAGTYDVKITLVGFIPVIMYAQEVVDGVTTTMESVPLVPESPHAGSISGTARDARTNAPIMGATVVLREGINATSGPVVASTTSASDGTYHLAGLGTGVYSIAGTAWGFADASRTGVVVGNSDTSGQDLIFSPISTDELRIVLTWGSTPRDLDSHLTGPAGDAGRFHVYYAYRGSLGSTPFALLDRDDTSAYGPETITITQEIPGIYRYSVFDYSNQHNGTSRGLGDSGAKVEVYRGSLLINRFNVPAGLGTLWTVFEMDGGVITPVNTLDFHTSGSSAIPLLSRFSTERNEDSLMPAMPPKGAGDADPATAGSRVRKRGRSSPR